ncbi:restriction endonuclease subunit S [Leuconostoc pseudomesenteroides]|uniref:restriction endonuclease subunit S n=1 Tax=Leuconostoc pseudomesenteroides TaxID=33968 RepID=UPI00345E4168
MTDKTMPALRFRGFYDAWEQRKLGEHSNILTGGTPKTSMMNYWEPKEIPWLSSGEVNKKRLNETDNMISKEGLENSSARWVKENSIMIALAGQGKTRGTVAVNNIPLTTNQSIAAIEPDETLNFEFIFQNLSKRYDELRMMSSGDGTRGGLNKKIIYDVRIAAPIIEEQEKIGAFFKQLDNTIVQNGRKIDLLKQLKQAYLQKIFSQELRFAGFSDDWEERKLSDVADYRNGKAHEQDIDEQGKYIVINSKFVSTNGKVKKYSNSMIEPLVKGELAFVLSDVPNGKAISRTFLIDKNDKYSLNQRIAGITPHKETDSYFLNVLMNRNIYFLKFDNGVGQTNLSKSDVEDFPEFYPNYTEQVKIGALFSNIDALITLNQHKLNLLKKQKQAYLQKMFI